MIEENADFRTELYARYVSAFKTQQLHRNPRELEVFIRWSERKYLPLLKKLDKNASILEVGCGDGKLLHMLKKNGYNNIEGVDISEEQIMLAKSEGLNVKTADIFTFLSDKIACYDAIIAIDVVEHFYKQEVLRLFRLFQKALKTSGILLLQTPNGEGLFPGQVIYGDLTHLCIFTPNSMRQILQLNGFSNISFYETSPVVDNWIGKIRFFLWSFVKAIVNTIRLVEGGKGKKSDILTENFICFCQKIENSSF